MSTSETEPNTLTTPSDSIQSHRKKIKEYALRYGIDLLFKEDIQISKNDLTLPWISGETIIYAYDVHPEVREDGKIIQINPYLRSTKIKAPTL